MIPSDAKVLTWSALENPDEPGKWEGYYCVLTYVQGDASAAQLSIDVETLYGDLDFQSWSDVDRRTWCDENSADDCERYTLSKWQKYITDMQENYGTSFENNMSSASCTAGRAMGGIAAEMALMTGTAYTTKTGYMIYDTEADYDAGTSSKAE